MMSRSSAEWMYSLGTGRKKCTPRLLMPRISLAGSSPMGSSIRLTVKKAALPAARLASGSEWHAENIVQPATARWGALCRRPHGL